VPVLAARSRLGLALGLLLLACGNPAGGGGTAETSQSRGLAPDFERLDLQGRPVRLSALRGRTVVIDFWATWCAPCVFQPFELNVSVLGVEIGGADVEEIRQWALENDAVAEYPILAGGDEALARSFGAYGFPVMVIVAPDGHIDSIHHGLTTAEEVAALVAPLLEAPVREAEIDRAVRTDRPRAHEKGT
jgi:thiol-disulfide isomerase/thioredoxin